MSENFSDSFKDVTDLIRGETYNYDPIGKCVYCKTETYSDNEKKLHREHIIPRSFGGKFVLLEASCKECARITSLAERKISRDLFKEARTHFKLPSYRSKNRPNALPRKIWREEDVKDEIVDLESHPFALTLPVFQTAGIIAGRSSKDKWEKVGSATAQWFPQGFVFPSSHYPEQSQLYSFEISHDYINFSRVLAKIAHSFAVAEYGMEYFKPMLNGIILGRKLNAPYLVGCVQGNPVIIKEKLHILELHERRVGRGLYLVCWIRMFGPISFPTYEVVVGKVKTLRRQTTSLVRHRSQP